MDSDLDPGTELESSGPAEMGEIPVPTWKYPDQGSKMGGFKIISANLSNKSNTNSHSGIPNWKIISTNLSNKSNSKILTQGSQIGKLF